MNNVSQSTQRPTQQATHWHGVERRSQSERREYSVQSLYCCLLRPRRSRGRRLQDRRFPLLDVFDSGTVLSVLLLLLFSILDAVFTLTLLSRGGTELNPVMNYFLAAGTAAFVSVKMLLTGIPAIILLASGNLLLFNRFRARSALGALVGFYAGLLLYEIALLWMSTASL